MTSTNQMMNDSFHLMNMTIPQLQQLQMSLANILCGTIAYSLIFLIGVVGNMLVIYVLIKERELRNFTNYLLANLSVADLLVLFTCVPTGLHDLYAKERWYLGKLMCYLIGFIENCMGFASILSIFFITCDRYYVICRPLKVRSVMTESRTSKLIIFIWIISILFNLPFILLSEYKPKRFIDGEIGYACNVKSRASWSSFYIISLTLIFYLLIGVIFIIFFYQITKTLNNSNQFLVSSSSYVNKNKKLKGSLSLKNSIIKESIEMDSLNSPPHHNDHIHCSLNNYHHHHHEYSDEIDHQKMSGSQTNISFSNRNDFINRKNVVEKQIKQRRQVIRMVMSVLIVFYVCLFPLKTWNIILMNASSTKGFFQKLGYNQYWFINITTRIFFYTNSSINPILYNFLSKKFRKSFKKLLIFRICFSDANKKSLFRTQTNSLYGSKKYDNNNSNNMNDEFNTINTAATNIANNFVNQ